MTNRDQMLPRALTGGIVACAFLALTGLEIVRALRGKRESKLTHVARNMTVAAIGGVVVSLAEQPAMVALARFIGARGLGFTQILHLPEPIRIAAALLLLDYTLYLWHVMTHKVPLLWRFHLPHHIDLDCDASTALRFHFGELLLSVPFRALQVVVFGATVRDYSIWQTLTIVSILFHHSNVDLSPRWDRLLSFAVVTPRMHGIHHDACLEHANSNWSSGLSIWDRLHGTLRLDVPQQEVNIGVPAFPAQKDVTLGHTLRLPFEHPRDDWNSAGAAGLRESSVSR